MTGLPRLRPEPIPAIHPLPEYRAEGPRKAWYEDMKQVFQVPWMGVVTMAYAHYPTFYETLWQGVRDLCASRPFVEALLGNRAFAETQVAKLDPPPIGERLRGAGYAPREIEQIRQVVEVFSHGNQPYVVLATLTRYLLEVGDMAGTPAHEEICRALYNRCVEQAARTLPNAGGTMAASLRRAAEKDAPFEEIRDMCRLFQWLLPGLVTNVAYLRAQLQEYKE